MRTMNRDFITGFLVAFVLFATFYFLDYKSDRKLRGKIYCIEATAAYHEYQIREDHYREKAIGHGYDRYLFILEESMHLACE